MEGVYARIFNMNDPSVGSDADPPTSGPVVAPVGTPPELTVLADYDAFYRRELGAMVALAGAITGSTVAAEDLAQEALIRAYKQWDKVGRYDKPGAWLRRVTINLALTNRKRLGAELKAKLRLSPAPTVAPTDHRFDDVWAAVAKLPGQQRAAVALHYLEDLPVAEIATILDCSESTAKVHLHRGRTQLASLLEGGR